MKITVKVTADDIKRGVRCVSHQCAVARAIKRVRPVGYKRAKVSVISMGISLFGVNPSMHAEIPKRAQRFIHRFDTGKKVKPFKFTIKFK